MLSKECYTPFWEVFAHFLIGKGPVFSPRFDLGKSLLTKKDGPYILHLYKRGCPVMLPQGTYVTGVITISQQ